MVTDEVKKIQIYSISIPYQWPHFLHFSCQAQTEEMACMLPSFNFSCECGPLLIQPIFNFLVTIFKILNSIKIQLWISALTCDGVPTTKGFLIFNEQQFRSIFTKEKLFCPVTYFWPTYKIKWSYNYYVISTTIVCYFKISLLNSSLLSWIKWYSEK